MKFITDNYIWIIAISVFLIFALIGFIVDTNNKKNKDNKDSIDTNPFENVNVNVNKNVNANIKDNPVNQAQPFEEKKQIEVKDTVKQKDKK